jgi:hypothetical protein
MLKLCLALWPLRHYSPLFLTPGPRSFYVLRSHLRFDCNVLSSISLMIGHRTSDYDPQNSMLEDLCRQYLSNPSSYLHPFEERILQQWKP